VTLIVTFNCHILKANYPQRQRKKIIVIKSRIFNSEFAYDTTKLVETKSRIEIYKITVKNNVSLGPEIFQDVTQAAVTQYFKKVD
jgi:hypothetical protein